MTDNLMGMRNGLSKAVCFILLSLPLFGNSWSGETTIAGESLDRSFSDAGTFAIRRGRKEIGRESFRLYWEGDEFKADAKINLNLSRGKALVLETRMALSTTGKVLAYRAERTDKGSKRTLEVTFQNQVAICEEKRESATASVPVVIEPGFVILDTNVFHHFAVMIQRILANPEQASLPVLIPQEAVAGRMRITQVGKDRIEFGKHKVRVTHYRLDSGQVKISIWFDDRGKLYRIRVPGIKAEVRRIEDGN